MVMRTRWDDSTKPRTNTNRIKPAGFSSLDAEKLYRTQWPAEPRVKEQYFIGLQCGGCSFYAEFDVNWGLCCHPRSRHRFETVFEHFTCPSFQNEGWGPHSFSTTMKCECHGVDIWPSKKPEPIAEPRVRRAMRDKGKQGRRPSDRTR